MSNLGLKTKDQKQSTIKQTKHKLQGLRITVKLTVFPLVVVLVLKALRESKRDRKKTRIIKYTGNISLDYVIEVAKVIMRGRSMAKELNGTLMENLGTCVSVDCSVDGKDPKDLQEEIQNVVC